MFTRPNETARLETLRRYRVVDTPREPDFDAIAEHAARVAGTPMAAVSFIEERRQWFKAEVGLGFDETPREDAFCQYTIAKGELWVVPDALEEPLLFDNPLVTGEQGIRFYAGAVIEAPDGSALGTVCVLDRRPRTLEPVAEHTLRMLAKQVATMLELRRMRHLEATLGTAVNETPAGISSPDERLRLTELDLVRAQRIAHLGSWELDIERGFLAWSEETYRIFGMSPNAGDPTYAEFFAAVHPEDCELMQAAQNVALAGTATLDLEHRIVRADTGEVRWVHELGELRRDADGRPVQLTGTTLDITERKATTDRLTRLNRVHRLLGETNEAIARASKLDALHIESARIAVESCGFALAAVVAATGGSIEAIQTSLGSTTEGTWLIAALNADGLLSAVVATAHPVVSSDLARDERMLMGRATYLASKVRSVGIFPLRLRGVVDRLFILGASEAGFFLGDEVALLSAVADDLSFASDAFVRDLMRTRAEQELAATRRQTELLLESVGEGIYGIDRAGRLVFANHVGRSMLGLGQGDPVGPSMHDLIHHHEAEGSEASINSCPIHATLRDGLTRKVDEDHFFRLDGESFPVEYVCASVTDESGAVTGAVVSFRDITERLRREALDAFESGVLELISADSSVPEIFDAVARGIERLVQGMRCTIMLPDDTSDTLRLVVAPSMTQEFREAVAGHSLSDVNTICGSAVHHKEAVVLESLDSAPTQLRRLLQEQHGIEAMWSVPVLGQANEVLAVFALFYDRPRFPERYESDIVGRISKLMRLAIDRDHKRRELRASDDFIRRTFASAAAGIIISDLERRFILTNGAFSKLVGYTTDELRDLDVTQLTHPDDRDSSDRLIRDTLEGRRESYVLEKRYVRKDGSAVWARVSGSAVRDADYRPVGMIAVTEDIGAEKEALGALLAATSLLRIAGRILRVGGWEYDPRSGALVLSDEVHTILGFETNRLRDLEFLLAVIQPAYRDGLVDALHRCARNGLAFDMDCEVATHAGERLWVRIIGEADTRDKTGERRLLGAFWDITRQREESARTKSLEAEASQLARRLRTTLESITDAFFTLDSEWRFTFINGEAEKLLGHSRDEVLGASLWEAFPMAVGSIYDDAYRHALSTGETAHFEVFLPLFKRWADVTAYPSSEGLAIHFRDETERRATGERLREQATLLERAQDAIIVRDLEHRIQFWNQSAERIYGWTRAEVMGQSVKHLLYSDTTTFLAAVSQVLEADEWTGELEQLTKDGKRVVVIGRWSLVRDDNGEPKAILAINTDITEKKRLEQQFLRAQRLESIGELAGGIAHDLNNVLAPILMAVSALVSEEEDAEKREDLGVIERSAERGASMVRQLLLFARGTTGTKTSLRFGDILAEVCRMMRDTFPRNITFNLNVAEDLWEIKADPTQMHQMLTNLCVNARDAMPDGGILTIALEKVVIDEIYAEMNLDAHAGLHVLVRVEDTGSGMAHDILERIFEPFFTTKEVGKGTGLGLSTVQAIVRGHGGFVNVDSELGKGTRFKIYFPAELPHDVRELVRLEQTTMPRGNRELVLVVDDEEAIRIVTRRTLERYGYRVMMASNGAEAVALFAQHHGDIDVVLTDMAMPIMDGPATIVALRLMKADVRIIGSSGFNAGGNISKAVAAGVKHFVPKPYTAEAMLRVLKRILLEPASSGGIPSVQ